MANNLDKPTIEAQAASIARLTQNIEAIGDPAVRAFLERIAVRVSQLKKAEDGENIILRDELNGHDERKDN